MNIWEFLEARAVRNVNPDVMIARTQRNTTYLYGFLFALVLAALVFLPKPMDETSKTVLQMLLAGLLTLITAQNSFWFLRQRAAGLTNPVITTTTTTTPQGTTNVTTTPTTVPPAVAASAAGPTT